MNLNISQAAIDAATKAYDAAHEELFEKHMNNQCLSDDLENEASQFVRKQSALAALQAAAPHIIQANKRVIIDEYRASDNPMQGITRNKGGLYVVYEDSIEVIESIEADLNELASLEFAEFRGYTEYETVYAFRHYVDSEGNEKVYKYKTRAEALAKIAELKELMEKTNDL